MTAAAPELRMAGQHTATSSSWFTPGGIVNAGRAYLGGRGRP